MASILKRFNKRYQRVEHPLPGRYKYKKSKDQAIYEAHLEYGYTLKDIAEYLGVYYTTVSE